MNDEPSPVCKYTADTPIFVPATPEGRFACFVELATGNQLVYAFTSVAKAEEFLRVMRRADCLTKFNRLLPCTMGEWFDWQPKKSLPNLTIDADPHAMADYPMRVSFDPEQQNASCLTTERPEGTVFHVQITPREKTS